MRQLLAKELREIIWAPLGLLGCLGIITVILYFQHWWGNGLIALYMLATSLFALYMGAEAVSGERVSSFLQWQQIWPVSRLKWWLLKFFVNLTITLVIGGLMYVLLGWLAAHNAPEAMKKGYSASALWLRAITLIPTFVMAFFCSSFSRTSMTAFGVAIALSWGTAILFWLPNMLYFMLQMRNGMPAPPPDYLILLPTILLTVAPLVGSLYGFLTTPPLEFGKRTARSFAAAGIIAVPGVILMVVAVIASTLLVTPKPQGVDEAKLSPDGQRLVFKEGHFGRRFWVANADGTDLRVIGRDDPGSIIWLGDSRRIVYSTQIMVPMGPQTGRTRTMTSSKDVQWWLLDTAERKPAPTKLFVLPGNQTGTDRLSPQGKYLWLGGEFIDVNTWKRAGHADVANYSPWFQTWLPDDSAIYVKEQPNLPVVGAVPTGPHQAPVVHVSPRGTAPALPQLMRIAVPSGQKTLANLPAAPTSRGSYFLNPATTWVAEDRSGWIRYPRNQWKPVTRTFATRTPDGKTVTRTYNTWEHTGLEFTKTAFHRLGDSRTFEIADWQPSDDGLSPDGRYCLMHQPDRGGYFNVVSESQMALLDMQTGKIMRTFSFSSRREDELRGPFWSRDSRTAALLLDLFGQSKTQTIYLLPVTGELRKISITEGSNAFASVFGGPIGWTAGGELLLGSGGNLVALGADGQQRVLIAGEDPWQKFEQKHPQQGETTITVPTQGRK